MRGIAIIAVVSLCALFTVSTGSSRVYAQEQTQPTQAQSQSVQKAKKAKVVKVRSGDTLSKIAKRTKSTYKRIYYFNKKVKHPDVIYPGQKLKIPSKNQKLQKRAIPGDTPKVVHEVKASSTRTTSYSAPKQIAAPDSNVSGGVWDRLAACESGGNWQINTGNGYYGGLQFSLSSWRGVGGSGYPHQASKAEQIKRATILKNSGGWGHWPACSAKLGLR